MNRYHFWFKNLVKVVVITFFSHNIAFAKDPKPDMPAAAKKCQELEAGIKAWIWNLNFCNQAQDCVVTDKISSNFPCPPGSALVNKNASLAFVVTQIEEFKESCPIIIACLQPHWTITQHPRI